MSGAVAVVSPVQRSIAMNDPRVERLLARSTWLPCLTAAQAERVRRDITVRTFRADSTVCVRATPSAHWLGVVDGLIKLENIAEDGRACTLASVPRGAWFGEGAVLKGEPRPYGVVALRDSVIAFLPRTTFLHLLDESHPFALWLIGQLNARLGHYIALVQNIRLESRLAHVAYGLCELFNPDLFPGTEKRIAISQEQLGRLSGVSRQEANRALHELKERGAIALGYGSIEVLDMAALQAAATEPS